MRKDTIYPKTAVEMENLGARCAQQYPDARLIFLSGQLGAGKTTWVRGFLRAQGYTDTVKSPSYTLLESYLLNGLHIYHFDFYRLCEPAEIEMIGMDDYIQTTHICLIEWPEKGKGYLPKPDLTLNLGYHDTGRTVTIMA